MKKEDEKDLDQRSFVLKVELPCAASFILLSSYRVVGEVHRLTRTLPVTKSEMTVHGDQILVIISGASSRLQTNSPSSDKQTDCVHRHADAAPGHSNFAHVSEQGSMISSRAEPQYVCLDLEV